MKIESLRIKLKLNIIFSAVLTLSIVIIHSYKFFKEKDYNQDIEKVRSEIINLKQRNTEVESKANDAKKYKEIWKKMSSTKKNMVGIKMDDVNSNLKKLSEKYSIIDPTIKVTLPENINEGLFKRETLLN
jgi:cell division protein FtsL